MSPRQNPKKGRASRAKPAGLEAGRDGKVWYVIAALAIIVGLSFYYMPDAEQPAPDMTVAEKTFTTSSDSLFEYETTRYPAYASVEPAQPGASGSVTVGVAVDTDSIKFGSIPTGENYGKRVLSIANLREDEAKITVRVGGEIASFSRLSEQSFVLGPNEERKVDVFFHASGAAVGDYSGYVEVVAKRPKGDFAKMFW